MWGMIVCILGNSLLSLRSVNKILLGFVASQKQKIKVGYSSGYGREL